MRLWLALVMLFAAPAAWGESIVAGLSHASVAITADFTGEEILVYGAIKREAPPPTDAPLEVIVTVEGPKTQVEVRRKARVFGIWTNTDSVTVGHAPSFYAVAATGPLEKILSETENLRHGISIPRAIRAVGISHEAPDAPAFLDALIRIRTETGSYSRADHGVALTEDTLFRTDIRLPANLTEGLYRVRLFILRGGRVIDWQEQTIPVQKAGLERWIFNLSRDQPLLYGLLSLLLAVVAGWGASAVAQMMRR